MKFLTKKGDFIWIISGMKLDLFRYMKICKFLDDEDGNPRPQICPDVGNYPWLDDTCGGNEPCKNCGE